MNVLRSRRFHALGLALVALSAIAIGCKGGKPARPPSQVTLAGTTFKVEVVNTPESRAQGLGGRAGLAPDAGMLFLFDQEQPQSFWMKDCYFPIDIAFIDAGGKIVSLATMAVEEFPPEPSRAYKSAGPAKFVLEVLGGTWSRIGAKPGMSVTFTGIPDAKK